MRKENAKFSDAVDDTEGVGEGSFLRRWSSRKRRARRGGRDESSALAPVEEAKASDADESAEPERVLTDEDMPPLESLNEDSDYSGFLSPGVSDSLRKLALRKMFLSSKYNVTDGLDDYAEDFTKFAPLGNVITADMRHRMEVEAERARQKLEEEARAAADRAEGEEDVAEAASGEAHDGDGGERQEQAAASGQSEAGGSEDQTSTGSDPRSG
jgi:hypothetical protein